MPRPSQRVRLESGLKLNLNSLARQGIIKPGAITGPVGIAWTDDTGHEIASGYITADLSDEHGGWLRIRLGRLDQCIYLVARPRHFGGRQWFFMCPHLHSRATVLWMPPGAHSCVSRTMGQESRIRLAIQGPHRQGSSGGSEDQIEALLGWWLRP
jgi:hypothetical protein